MHKEKAGLLEPCVKSMTEDEVGWDRMGWDGS